MISRGERSLTGGLDLYVALAGGSPHPQGGAQRRRGPLPTAPDWVPVPGTVMPDVVISISLGDAMAMSR